MPLKHVEPEDVEIVEGAPGDYFVTVIGNKHPALYGPAARVSCERWIDAKLVRGMATAPIRMEKPIAEETAQ